jgi:hypothetical protein
VRATRLMAMATRVEGNEEGHGDGGKSNGNCNKGDRQATAMVTKRVAGKQRQWQ